MVSPLVPVDEAIQALDDRASRLVGVETLPILQALGRVLAQDVVSGIQVPPHDNSAMDGYAVRTQDIDTQSWFEVSDRIPAGSVGKPLVAGTVARIFTGAPMPEHADAIVIQEDTLSEDGRVQCQVMPKRGEHVRRAGQDIAQGSVVLTKGRKLKPQDIGLIASVGLSHVDVFKRLKVAVMSTGDELVDPPHPLAAGQIYNSNHYTLQSLIKQLGMEPVDLGMVADTAAATEKALLRGAADADCILSSGGVSVGEEDHVKAAIEKLGSLELWRLAIKPGKPLAFGQIDDTPLFGLPGNPVSSFVTFMLIARRYLLKSQGCTDLDLTEVEGVANFSAKGGKRREYYRVRLQQPGGRVDNFQNQGSGVMSSVSWANALAQIEIGQNIEAGDKIKVLLLPD